MIFNLGGNHIILSAKGRRKILNFRFAVYIYHWKKNFGRIFAYRKQKCG